MKKIILSNEEKCYSIESCLRCPELDLCEECETGFKLNKTKTKFIGKKMKEKKINSSSSGSSRKSSGSNPSSSKKEIFNLNEDDKNNGLKASKSCYLNNRHNIDNIRYLTMNQSANCGNCFACNLGCSVSKSGYSPMNYSPYNGMKRRDNLGIPTHILYQCVKKI